MPATPLNTPLLKLAASRALSMTLALMVLPLHAGRAQGAAKSATDAQPARLPVALSAASNTLGRGTLAGRLEMKRGGAFTVDGLGFSVLHKSRDWAPAYQRDMQMATGYPRVTPESQTVRGSLKTDSGSYEYLQELKETGPGQLSLSATLSGNPTKDTRILALALSLPLADYRGQKVHFDETAHQIPWWFKGQALVQGHQRVRRVRVPLKTGNTIVLEGDLEAYLEDNREYGAADISLQISFAPNTGPIERSGLKVSIGLRSPGDPLHVAYDTGARQPARLPRPASRVQQPEGEPARVAASLARLRPLPALRPRGEDFVDAQGKRVRFWGMNAVSFYPDYALAEKTAANMASLGINMVRLHHNLRPSGDWAPADTHALVTYEADSRTPNLKAWDRYDYFNARLREKGIYLSASLHSSRTYLPEDVGILKVSAEDDEAWAAAMDDLNHWTWRKAIDPRKMLPVIDERCFLLNAEFARNFLGHVNPYTGLAYAADPQLATLELINEFSSEYTLITGNTFPEYWTKKLNDRLRDYLRERGIAPFTIEQRKNRDQQRAFAGFCHALDEAYARRMETVVREAGYKGPLAFSNLWRGDANLRLRSTTDDFIEDHAYLDPLVVQDPDNFLFNVSKSSVAGKPIIIGEFNQAENARTIGDRKSVLSMLPMATAAYSSLQNHAGVIWFAWSHGGFRLNAEGWAKSASEGTEAIGTLAGNTVMLDHLRSAGLIYRNGYLSQSVRPQTVFVHPDYYPDGYNSLMRGEHAVQPGWQAVHGFRKAFGPVPAGQADAPWLKTAPPNPAVSDSQQIVRDSRRRQLTFSAPKTEGFSGYLDGKPGANLQVLSVSGDAGFATVMAVTLDDSPLRASRRILLSRTVSAADADAKVSGTAPHAPDGVDTGSVSLKGLTAGTWKLTVTRPDRQAPATLATGADGILKLPDTPWAECELQLQ